ncbi:MAG: S8 family serine peptidase [Rivularia sp. (in: Bacteria)]|nr:S8 family serine peptidase [Rivularia sp. MS3]
MKRLLSGILLTSGLWVLTSNLSSRAETLVVKKSQEQGELFYNYDGKKIHLEQRNDVIAVAFKPEATQNTNVPLYIKLQQDFRRNRDTKVEIEPLNKHYALMKLASDSSNSTVMQLRLSQKAYVDKTFPVFSRRKYSEEIILPNEIIVSFEEQISPFEKQVILNRHKLEIIRPLRFSKNRYVVKSTSTSGTDILKVANRIYQVRGVKSATPNFILLRNKDVARKAKEAIDRLKKSQIKSKLDFQSNLLLRQWHLQSNPLRVCLTKFTDDVDKCLSKALYKKSGLSLPNTGIRATEAWRNSKAGKGVVVAVLDSLIQWNHPDLVNNVYKSGDIKDKRRGEINGWDFADDDADTKMSQKEFSTFGSIFQDSYRLSDDSLLEKYGGIPLVRKLLRYKPQIGLSRKDIVAILRDYLRYEVTGLFHGTFVAGVIAANSPEINGLSGVAPQASILPVNIGKTLFHPLYGFEQSIEMSDVLEGIDYAVARGADVINMSFGGFLPTAEVKNSIIRAQNKNPNIVFVAAAGNETDLEVSFPAAVKGVIAVGATNINGYRAPYSNFGNGLTVVAPGGDSSTKIGLRGAILTTGGTGTDNFWRGILIQPKSPWGSSFDNRGKYVRVEGTSFSSPVVAGIIALMKGEDPQRRLSRKDIIAILKRTASYDALSVPNREKEVYKFLLLSGNIPDGVSIEQYFFGNGLVNAHTAVKEVQRQLRKYGK